MNTSMTENMLNMPRKKTPDYFGVQYIEISLSRKVDQELIKKNSYNNIIYYISINNLFQRYFQKNHKSRQQFLRKSLGMKVLNLMLVVANLAISK